MKTFVLSIVLIIICGNAVSQNILKGKVFDSETTEPLIGATVMVPNTTNGVLSDIDGAFELPIENQIDSIEISYIGYEKKIISAKSDLLVALEPSINNLQQIVVTANREASLRAESPIAISKVSTMTINDTKPVLVAELINKVPGVVMVNYNNEQHAMSIRQPMGTSAYFLYLEDGLPVRPMGIFNHNALIEMNVFGISNIEVVKGPASSLYGPEAVGGAINFITHRPTAVPVVKVGMQGDEWGYRRIQYGAGGTMGEKLGVFVSGFEARQNNAWQTSSDYNKSSINARLDYSISKRTKLTVAFSGNEYYSEMAGSVDSISFYSRQYSSTTDFTYRKVHSQRTRLTLVHQWNDRNETSVTLAYRDNYIEQNPSYAIRWVSGSNVASGERNRNAFYSRVALVQHRVDFNFLDARLLEGASFDYSPTDYWAYRIDLAAQLRPDGKSVERYDIVQEQRDQFLSKYQADLKNYALYSQFEINPHQRLKFTLGLRYDLMAFDFVNHLDASAGRKSFERITPKVGATFDLLNDKGLYVNFSEGFAPPGLTSIFRTRPGTSGSDPGFYYNLEPARFNNFEIGGWAAFFESKVYIDFAAYQMTGRNELLNIRREDSSTDYQSAGKTLHRGIEYGLTFKPTDQWFFRFGGTNAIHVFQDFELSTRATDDTQNVDGMDMPQAPRWIANYEITYKPDFVEGFRISLEWQRIGSWFQDQTNKVKYEDKTFLGLRGVSYLNLRAGYEFHGLEIFTNITNITDELYANAATRGISASDRTTFIPAAPRTMLVGLQYTFTGKNKSIL
jgi:outer membrane receptor protein involved in Fe transport